LQSSYLPSKPVPQVNADSLRVETVVDDDNSGNDESHLYRKPENGWIIVTTIVKQVKEIVEMD
jgi:hypothetical protein